MRTVGAMGPICFVGALGLALNVQGVRLARAVGRRLAAGPFSSACLERYFLPTGTGMPGIFTLTDPRWLRLVK